MIYSLRAPSKGHEYTREREREGRRVGEDKEMEEGADENTRDMRFRDREVYMFDQRQRKENKTKKGKGQYAPGQ